MICIFRFVPLRDMPTPVPRSVPTFTMRFSVDVGVQVGWWILDEPELHIGGDVLVPDIAGWRRERLSELPDSSWFEIAPDWVCEVLSPSTAQFDREEKLPIYAKAGVEFLWMVDPSRRSLQVLRRQEQRWRLIASHAGKATISEPPFAAATVELGPLWVE